MNSPFSGIYEKNSIELVYFKMEVLEKYFEDPKYLVFYSDYRGSICLADEYVKDDDTEYEYLRDFGLAYEENDSLQRAIVIFACDIFSMSIKMQCHWFSYLLEDQEKYIPNYGFYKNLVLGEWVENISIYQALTMEIEYTNKMCKSMRLPELYLKEFPSDGRLQNERPNNYHTILLPTQKRYYDFVNTLEKMTTGNINKKLFTEYHYGFVEINDKDDNGNYKGSLSMLCEWLSKNTSANVENSIKKPLRKLIKERQTPAHIIYKNEYDTSIWKRQKELMHNTYVAIRNIRLLFANHPDAKQVEIPVYLFDGKHIVDY